MTWAERLVERIDVQHGDDPCWLWTGSVNGGTNGGYGHVGLPGAGPLVYVHRLVFVLLVGPIPEGMTLDHSCRVRRCCNPSHLEVVTRAENSRRGNIARSDVCPQGHRFDGENTRTTPRGHRRCRACHRDDMTRRRQAAQVDLPMPLVGGAS